MLASSASPRVSPRALLLGMDGVIVDAEPVWYEVARAFAAERGAVWTQEHAHACMGRGLAYMLRRMHELFGFPIDTRKDTKELKLALDRHADELALAPGCMDLLDAAAAAKVDLAVVTSWPGVVVGAQFRRLGLDTRLRHVMTSGSSIQPKPAPDMFLLVARMLGALPSACAALVGSPSGAAGAHAAGMFVIAVARGASSERAFGALADRIVPNLPAARELLDLRPACSGRPAFDAEATRAAYLERFGPLFDAWAAEDEDFWILCFWDPSELSAPVTYASFGAPGGEVYLVSRIPSYPISCAVEKAARVAPGERDLPALIRARAPWTPFSELLLVAPEDGSFAVAGADGTTRPVLRAVALTFDESREARKDPGAVLGGLRAAGAMVADVLRDCTVDPSYTDWFRRVVATHNVRSLRRWRHELAQERDSVRARGASVPAYTEHRAAEVRAALRDYESRLPEVPTEAEVLERRTTGPKEARYAAMLSSAIDRTIGPLLEYPYSPERVAGFLQVVGVMLSTHPDVVRHLQVAAAGLAAPPVPFVASSAEEMGKELADTVRTLAHALHGDHPRHDADDLTRCAIEALACSPDLKEQPLKPDVGWAVAAEAMYQRIFPAGRSEMGNIIHFALTPPPKIDGSEPDPFERIVGVCEKLVLSLHVGEMMSAVRDS